MPPKKKTKAPAPTTAAPVTSYKHDSTRKRIPTQEESVKLSKREKQPVKKTYTYDPSLDPQLTWSGKREAGAEFDVPTVPIYVQEHVAPEALIARLKTGASDDRQMLLFGETAEDQFQKAVEFYKHEDNWQNRMILGDSLLVMNSLLEKEGMRGKVQTIYIDPPYGIKFGSNWQVSTRKKDIKDRVEDFVRQPEQVKAFRDTWDLGIHSYLSYLRDRLFLARELLNESGSCFVQINDDNVHLVRNILDEVFGSENFCQQITFVKTSGQRTKDVHRVSDYILWYAKDYSNRKYRQFFVEKSQGNDENEDDDFSSTDLTSINPGYTYIYKFEGKSYKPGSRYWSITEEKMKMLEVSGRLYGSKNTLRYKRLPNDFPYIPLSNVWTDTTISGAEGKVYVVQTGQKVIAIEL